MENNVIFKKMDFIILPLGVNEIKNDTQKIILRLFGDMKQMIEERVPNIIFY